MTEGWQMRGSSACYGLGARHLRVSGRWSRIVWVRCSCALHIDSTRAVRLGVGYADRAPITLASLAAAEGAPNRRPGSR